MKVLFIDDKTFNMKYHVRALREANIHVVLRSDVRQAISDFKDADDWAGVIVDVMFDESPEYYREQDPDGQNVGLFLARELKKIRPKVKIIGLTNLVGRDSAQELGRMPGVLLLSKLKYDAISFCSEVQSFFGGTS